MSNLKQHKQALFCNDNEAINDYETAMHNAVQAVSAWLKMKKCTQAVQSNKCEP